MSDLISREALMEYARNHVGHTIDCNDIARFPAVDAEPVRHGRWEGVWNGGWPPKPQMHCTLCNKQIHYTDGFCMDFRIIAPTAVRRWTEVRKMKIEVTKDQCISVIDYIETNLLDVIRNDGDIDNIDWVSNLLTVRDTMKKAVGENAEYT